MSAWLCLVSISGYKLQSHLILMLSSTSYTYLSVTFSKHPDNIITSSTYLHAVGCRLLLTDKLKVCIRLSYHENNPLILLDQPQVKIEQVWS